MTRENKIAMLRLAKELTETTCLDSLINTTKKLEAHLNQNEEAKPIPLTLREFIANGVMIPHQNDRPLDRAFVPFVPYDYQSEMADKLCEPQRQVLISSRQMDMELLVSLYTLWSAMSKPNQSIMVMNTPEVEAYNDLSIIYELWSNYTGAKIHCERTGKSMIRFDNGSMIYGREAHAANGRGRSLTHLVFNNAASISYSQAPELDAALQPMLATGGKVLLVGIPDEPRGYFFNTTQSSMFEVIRCPWTTHPERDEEWEKFTRATMSEADWRSQYECHFVSRQ